MLAVLLNPPRSQAEWDRFAFHHRNSHLLIKQKIQQNGGANLPEYVIYPFAAGAANGWLEANQQFHIDFNGALGLPSVDLLDVDLQDDHQLRDWLFLHWEEHQIAETKLGIGS